MNVPQLHICCAVRPSLLDHTLSTGRKEQLDITLDVKLDMQQQKVNLICFFFSYSSAFLFYFSDCISKTTYVAFKLNKKYFTLQYSGSS